MNQAFTSSEPFIVSTFYKFVALDDTDQLKASIQQAMQRHEVGGTVILAREGINATVSAKRTQLDALMDELQQAPIGSLHTKESVVAFPPFIRAKVKCKPELISLGVPADPTRCVGTYVKPADWNALITQPDVMTIDTRNDYEYRIGRFKGAINPQTNDFKEMVAFTELTIDPAIHKRVAMYCTGGIRCEKYSSYLLDYGVEQVFHLDGGVLQYLEDIPQNKSLWEGVCYVFDDRVAVNHDLSDAVHITKCPVCGNPQEPHDRAHERYIAGKQCRYCFE